MGKVRLQRELCAGTLVISIDENHREIKNCPHSELVINASYQSCESNWYTAQLTASLYIHAHAYQYKHIHLSRSDNRQRWHKRAHYRYCWRCHGPCCCNQKWGVHALPMWPACGSRGPSGMASHKGTAKVHSEGPTSRSLRTLVVESVPDRLHG